MLFSLHSFLVDEPLLSFQRNTFLPLREERNLLKKQKSDDPNNYCSAIDLLYHEVRGRNCQWWPVMVRHEPRLHCTTYLDPNPLSWIRIWNLARANT